MMSWRSVAGVVAFAAVAAWGAERPLHIEHTPVTVGVRGQPLMVRIKVVGPAASPKSATLFYSTSKDAAPYSVQMQPTGAGGYVGTIPGGILSTLDRITYYLAAEDAAGVTAETPWYVVRIQAGAAPASADQRPGWVKPALIGGGVALVAGGVALAVGGGGDGGGGGAPAPDTAGVYTGTSTECQTPAGLPPACASHGISIAIGEDGTVRSTDLREGTSMAATLSGASFVMIAPVYAEGPDGEVRYIGTVIDNRVVGTIEGSFGTGTNTVLVSGTFSAVKP